MVRTPTIVHQRESTFGTLFVVDHLQKRHLRFGTHDGMEQSVVSLVDPRDVQVEYIREAFVALAMVDTPKRLLMVGLGGGVFSSRLHQALPKTRIDVVDVSADVVDIAKTYFGVCEDTHLRIHVEDARTFVARTRHTYDLALLDAYGGEGVPWHLGTQAFFQSVRAKMPPSGVAVLNIAIDDLPAEKRLIRNFQAVFGYAASLRTPKDDNILVMGSSEPLMSHTDVQQRAQKLSSQLELSWKLAPIAARLDYSCASAFAGK